MLTGSWGSDGRRPNATVVRRSTLSTSGKGIVSRCLREPPPWPTHSSARYALPLTSGGRATRPAGRNLGRPSNGHAQAATRNCALNETARSDVCFHQLGLQRLEVPPRSHVFFAALFLVLRFGVRELA